MGTVAWVSRSCVLGVNSLRARMVVLELLNAAPHSGTKPGLLIRGPGSHRLSGDALLRSAGGRPTELGASADALAGQMAVAGARYCRGSGGRR